MTVLPTARQMRALEAAAFAAGATDSRATMAAAGAAVAAAIARVWPGPRGRRALVLCGPGANGGDGYDVARRLRDAGWQVTLGALALPADPTGDAAAMRAAWIAGGGPVAPLEDVDPAAAEIVVDALFGIGLSRPLPPEAVRLADALAATKGRPGAPAVIAIDIPSGLCADSGRILGAAIVADLTVAIEHPKPGHHLADGPAVCGRLCVVAVGIPGVPAGAARLVGPPPAALLAKVIAAPGAGEAHKYRHGAALILGGGSGQGGAARLAARAALRIGAGLVRILCPREALAENAARLDAVMLDVADTLPEIEEALAERRLGALLAGPNLGLGRARAVVPRVLALGLPCVLDADAISAFADDPAALRARLHPGVVLTPHGGEFGRLFPDLAARWHEGTISKIDAAQMAARLTGACIVLKGPDTVIATPEGPAALHSAAYGRAVPWLATAGAGDVLAGLICGLLARGRAPGPAAEAAVWIHAEAARGFGPGLIAEDLPDALPAVLAALPDGGAAP